MANYACNEVWRIDRYRPATWDLWVTRDKFSIPPRDFSFSELILALRVLIFYSLYNEILNSTGKSGFWMSRKICDLNVTKGSDALTYDLVNHLRACGAPMVFWESNTFSADVSHQRSWHSHLGNNHGEFQIGLLIYIYIIYNFSAHDS